MLLVGALALSGGQGTTAAFPAVCERYASMLANAGQPACASCITTLGSVSGPYENDFGGTVETTGPCTDVNVSLGA